nr:hypothetical protein [Tanacetum cinerariifolium]
MTVDDSSSGSLINTPFLLLVEAAATLTGVAVIVAAGTYGSAAEIIVLAVVIVLLAVVITSVISLAVHKHQVLSEEDSLGSHQLVVELEVEIVVVAEVIVVECVIHGMLMEDLESNAAEGFEQIIDFLSGSYIHYALIVSPHIYISCIKQFWNSVSVKRSGDVTRLQALVDKKKIVISEAVIQEILQLNNAEGVVCFPNEEIFAGLAQMGYEKPSTKLTFYKAFFSSQWNFLIHTILQSLSTKRTSWNEFSTAMASAVICLSKGQRFNFFKYIFDSLVRNVDSSSKFYMYPRFIQLIIQTNIADLSTHTTRYISPVLTQKVFANMRRVGKGFSGVETPLFESMLAVTDVAKEAEAQVPAQGDDVQGLGAEEVVTEVVPPTPTPPSPSSPVIPSSPHHQLPYPPQPQDAENDKAAQQLEIVKLKARVKKLEKINKVKSSKLKWLKKVGTSQRIESLDDIKNVFNQGRMVADMDMNEGIELVKDAEVAESKGRNVADHTKKQA